MIYNLILIVYLNRVMWGNALRRNLAKTPSACCHLLDLFPLQSEILSALVDIYKESKMKRQRGRKQCFI